LQSSPIVSINSIGNIVPTEHSIKTTRLSNKKFLEPFRAQKIRF
jgi:hypothetical protein